MNGGTSWTARGTELPAFSAQVVRVDPTDTNRLFCGTDVGVYHSTDGGATWTRFGTGMPAVSVYDLAITSDGSIVRAATHGRGIWELTVTGVTNTQPTVAISAPATSQTIARGDTVTFTGTFSDAQTTATAKWHFADTWTNVTATSGGSVQHTSTDIIVSEPGDLCTAPITIAPTTFPYTVTANMDEATYMNTDPLSTRRCYPFTPIKSVWVQFTAPTTATYHLSACGSKGSAIIAGYSTPSIACAPNGQAANYTAVACRISLDPSGDCNSEATVTFSGTAGQTYRFLLTNYYSNDWGQVSMTINQGAPPGTNHVPLAVDPPVGSTTGERRSRSPAPASPARRQC